MADGFGNVRSLYKKLGITEGRTQFILRYARSPAGLR